MPSLKQPPPPPSHRCPVCQFPQTKIQRILSQDRYGSISYVCSRVECTVGLDLSKVDTWAAV